MITEMNVVGTFHKVSKEEYDKCVKEELISKVIDYDDIKLPVRATKGSAGYDFYLTKDIYIEPECSVIIDTMIKCEISEGAFLMIVPRSSLGFKYNIGLSNTVGIIDSDYYNNPENEGHIKIKLTNRNTAMSSTPVLFLSAGDRFAQGIFLPYGLVTNDTFISNTRTGGFGSSGKE